MRRTSPYKNAKDWLKQEICFKKKEGRDLPDDRMNGEWSTITEKGAS